MNQAQREHIKDRIDRLTKDKLEKAHKHCVTHKGADTDKEKWDLIKRGVVKAKKDFDIKENNVGYSYELERLFDFSKHKTKVDDVSYAWKRSKIVAEAQKAKDIAVLGKPEDAIKAIEAFEKFAV